MNAVVSHWFWDAVLCTSHNMFCEEQDCSVARTVCSGRFIALIVTAQDAEK